MSGESVRIDHIVLVLIIAALIASFALALGSVAFRRNHYLIDWVKQFRCSADTADSHEHEGTVRVNLVVLSAFLLWLAVMVCAMGIRYVVR